LKKFTTYDGRQVMAIHEIKANDGGNWTQNLTMKLASQYFLKSIWIALVLLKF
jgi:hypothetical protein